MSSNYCVYMCITRKMCIDKFPSRKFNCLFWKVVFVQQFSCIYQLETDKTSNKFFFDMQNILGIAFSIQVFGFNDLVITFPQIFVFLFFSE